MLPTQTAQVLIAGAGPAGMTLAYLLARRGVRVTVVEAHHDFSRNFRGEGLQRSGIDAFRQMGLGEKFDALPFAEIKSIDMFARGRLSIHATAAGLGRGQARLVSQAALLQMLASEASQFPGFRLDTGVTVRDFIRQDGRIVGIRASTVDGPREYRADLVVGADGRSAATRKHSGFAELTSPQNYDIIWLKVPLPANYPSRSTAVFELATTRAFVAFPTADNQLQVGFVIPKGGYAALRAGGPDAFAEALIGRLPAMLADHLRKHRESVTSAAVLNVVSGRLTEWTSPGLLLIGDAAHPMSPVGGQGVNLALRDALVAANHLCPVLVGRDNLAIADTTAFEDTHRGEANVNTITYRTVSKLAADLGAASLNATSVSAASFEAASAGLAYEDEVALEPAAADSAAEYLAALDTAARRVQDERLPEIVAVQKLQENQARMLFNPDSFNSRLIHRLLPLLVRTGLLQWLHRKEYQQMSNGVVPVRLVV